MEKEVKIQRASSCKPAVTAENDFLLQWGNRKRLRCVRVKDKKDPAEAADPSYGRRIRRKVTSRFLTDSHKDASFLQPPTTRLTRNSETVSLRSENRKASPEEDDKYYTTRGSAVEENGKVAAAGEDDLKDEKQKKKKKRVVWPKMYLTLSSKEKEEDFMAMKGCKLPLRPKKRAKIIQRTLLLVSPGAWLTEMCQERYEVREKKSSKKQRPRGLKAMGIGGSMESDSEDRQTMN